MIITRLKVLELAMGLVNMKDLKYSMGVCLVLAIILLLHSVYDRSRGIPREKEAYGRGLFSLWPYYATERSAETGKYNKASSDIAEDNVTCIIYTYFQEAYDSSRIKREHRDTIHTWTTSWRAAGWNPRLLSEEDAKSHPQYLELRRKFEALPTVNKGDYDLACFIRYVAMAAVGGGWMSDFDILPFYMPRCLEPLNEGNFTVYDLSVPSLVSGNASEFTRMANRMANVDYRGNPKQFSRGGEFHVSDMFVLLQLYHEHAYVSVNTVVETADVFDGGSVCDSHEQTTGVEEIPKGFPKKPWAIHYSHAALSFLREKAAKGMSLWPGSSWNAERLSQPFDQIRADFMKDSIEYVRGECDIY